MTELAADPFRDTAVIDARAPRVNQATVGVVSLVALATGWWWLWALLALQLALGLTLGRRGACRALPTSRSSSRASARGRSRTRVRPGSRTWSASCS
jgi:hypothetical protein